MKSNPIAIKEANIVGITTLNVLSFSAGILCHNSFIRLNDTKYVNPNVMSDDMTSKQKNFPKENDLLPFKKHLKSI